MGWHSIGKGRACGSTGGSDLDFDLSKPCEHSSSACNNRPPAVQENVDRPTQATINRPSRKMAPATAFSMGSNSHNEAQHLKADPDHEAASTAPQLGTNGFHDVRGPWLTIVYLSLYGRPNSMRLTYSSQTSAC